MNTTLTIKTPKKLRDDAKRTAAELGIPLTTVMNAMLKQFVREQTITVSAYPKIKPEKLREWEKASDHMDKHPEKYKAYSDIDELFAHWDKVRTKKNTRTITKRIGA